MARSKKKSDSTETFLSTFQHGSSKRLNIPEATETQSGLSKGKRQQYRYNPHLSPVIRFDETGGWDSVKSIVEKVAAGKTLTQAEVETLRVVCGIGSQPWLEWAGKQEQQARGGFGVDDVVLHIHERISAQAIVAAAKRDGETDYDMFARPRLHREQALQYYRHSMDWANRLVLGDSLQVMSSLARREGLAGQVQMIYIDPPYGIKYSSNWQNEVGKRDVKDKDEDITREAETIRAYRDTWKLGVHSYLTYIQQRLAIARELLTESGSVFVQISDENVHRVRAVMDEVFGQENFISLIVFQKTGGFAQSEIPSVADYIVWYAKNRKAVRINPLHVVTNRPTPDEPNYVILEMPDGSSRRMTTEEKSGSVPLPAGSRIYRYGPLTSDGAASTPFTFNWADKNYEVPANSHWKTNKEGLERMGKTDRLIAAGQKLSHKLFWDYYPAEKLSNIWQDTQSGGFNDPKAYVVQTTTKVIQRCMLMTTIPGELVLDPTCGSGTTAYVAEQWGRRWITIDSSRVAFAIARQRLLTCCFDAYKTKDPASGIDPSAPQNPGFGFYYKTVPHITLKSIAQNKGLDAVFAKHDAVLKDRLRELNISLQNALLERDLISRLVTKLRAKVDADGARAVSDSDLRRWLLPTLERSLVNFGTPSQRKKWHDAIPKGLVWNHWEVPFDPDPEWPLELQHSLKSYRTQWRQKMDEVNSMIEKGAEQEELFDEPDIVRGVARVSGPFTVEGVRPEELALGEDGKVYDPTANDSDQVGSANADSFIDLMIGLLRKDGVTFIGNRRAEFKNLVKEAGRSFHARGQWTAKADELDNVAVFFGPQYGPVNAPMMREAIEGAQGLKEVDELVVAGFSFDAAAQEVAKDKDSNKLRIHLAHIRPDVSPGMQDLLKETANSQLFTVFGQPDITLLNNPDGLKQVKMGGVCVYNPLTGEISEAAAGKVAAWFLDSDYDGRCFCISQAFFPDKEAWTKIANALGGSVREGMFDDATISWPFQIGKHKRIAVKVIDPRGNEVMAIKTLNP